MRHDKLCQTPKHSLNQRCVPRCSGPLYFRQRHCQCAMVGAGFIVHIHCMSDQSSVSINLVSKNATFLHQEHQSHGNVRCLQRPDVTSAAETTSQVEGLTELSQNRGTESLTVCSKNQPTCVLTVGCNGSWHVRRTLVEKRATVRIERQARSTNRHLTLSTIALFTLKFHPRASNGAVSVAKRQERHPDLPVRQRVRTQRHQNHPEKRPPHHRHKEDIHGSLIVIAQSVCRPPVQASRTLRGTPPST